VARGVVTLTAARFDNTSTFYSPVVSTGGANLAPARYDNAQVFYGATLTTGAVSLTAARFDNVNAFFAAVVSTGATTLAPARFDNSSQFFSATVGARSEPFGPPDWKYRVNTGGGPIGPFTVQRKRRRPLPVDQQQEDDSLAVDPWDQQFREIALAEDAEISEFLFGLVSSGVLDGHV